jgi:hypothetical protein
METVVQLALALERLIFERCLQRRLWEKKNVRRPGIEPGSAIWNMTVLTVRPPTLVGEDGQPRDALSRLVRPTPPATDADGSTAVLTVATERWR